MGVGNDSSSRSDFADYIWSQDGSSAASIWLVCVKLKLVEEAVLDFRAASFESVCRFYVGVYLYAFMPSETPAFSLLYVHAPSTFGLLNRLNCSTYTPPLLLT